MSSKLPRVPIRFSPRTHALIKREAEIEGVTITQYVREAALSRAYYAIGQRNDPPEEAREALRLARALLREEDSRRHSPGSD